MVWYLKLVSILGFKLEKIEAKKPLFFCLKIYLVEKSGEKWKKLYKKCNIFANRLNGKDNCE